MELELATCRVRSWREEDAADLARHADDAEVWRNLRDAFPFPYGLEDAHRFLRRVREARPECVFAIEVEGAAAGSIGFTLGTDIERVSAEIGYWLGREFWGRGIVTEALQAVTRQALAEHGLTRVFALPFSHNRASARVLEKAGYVLEGCLRRSAIKEGVVQDQLQYAFVAPEA
jgi:RimJ/RimL family protein N-acetyltransferase